MLWPLLPNNDEHPIMINPRPFTSRPTIPILDVEGKLVIGEPNTDAQL